MAANLNFKHLYYFWMIAREGSIARASELLDLTPQTLSGQLASLEAALEGLLFHRQGRTLRLTDLGKTVFQHADEMFIIAEQLREDLEGRREDRPAHLAVGIAASIHKLYAYRLIRPALETPRTVRLDCRTGATDHLLDDLKRQRLDLVLTDRPPLSERGQTLYSYELERTTISLFAAPEQARKLAPGFPGSLDGAPFLVNATDSPYVRDLMQWFAEQHVRLNIVAEVDDSALIKVFGRNGMGLFAAPTAISDEVCRQYQVESVGQVSELTESLYAVTRIRPQPNSPVGAICMGDLADGKKSKKPSNN